MNVQASGVYRYRVNKGPWQETSNMIVDQGLIRMLTCLVGGTAGGPHYMMLYATDVDPASTWTAANFEGNADEITSGTEGYSETTRPLWDINPAPSTPGLSPDNPCVFTIVTATSIVVEGMGLSTIATKGSGGGSLLSAARLTTPLTLVNADVLEVEYDLFLTATP